MLSKCSFKNMIAIIGMSLLSSNVFAIATIAQPIIGIAINPGQNIEVSFQDMTNSFNCTFNGAYKIDSTLDVDTKKSIISLLLTAKATNKPIRLSLIGCDGDRPKFNGVFMDATWL